MPIRLRHTTRHPQLPGNREPLGLWLSHVKTELFVAPLSLSIVIAILDQVDRVALPKEYWL
jgi:hypothetical protein